jgi:hypothetical protein
MDASLDAISGGARTYLRDFPLFFEVDQGAVNTLTVRLPHPLVSSGTLGVYITTPPVAPATDPTTTPTTAWQLDERNGLLKLTDETLLNKRLLIAGYHFTWFLDSDLSFHAGQVLGEMTHSGYMTLDSMGPAHLEVIMLGTIVHALWSLAMELSLDIDVSTPEGMFIPAHQRYQQVTQMIGVFEAQYNDKAAMLGMGLGALEVFGMRRVALTTGRYVPVYREREYDDPRPPTRLYPQIPYGVPPGQQDEPLLAELAPIRHTVEEIAREGQDFGFGGWRPVGWSGAP